MAGKVDALALFLLAITVFFTLLVLVLVAFMSLRYRRKSTDFTSPNPPATHTSTLLEVAWSVIPFGIVMVIFVWGTKLYVEEYQAPAGAMEVHVIGKQWMWKIQHPDGRREINQLTVPVGVPVKLIMTSQDVIHDFGMPAFRVKQDVVPGRYSYVWFQATKVGDYHLFCQEYCGTQHSGMIGTIRVLKAADYQAWLRGLPAGTASEREAGRAIYQQFACYKCHGVNAPTLAGLYGKDEDVVLADGTGRRVKADDEYLRESILYPRAKIVKGFRADLMPTYQGQMTEEQLAALLLFIKTAGPGDLTTPQDPGTKMQEQQPASPDLSTYQSGSGPR